MPSPRYLPWISFPTCCAPLLFALAVSLAKPLAAAEHNSFLALTADNDNFASRNDRHYSSGARLSLGLPAGHRAAWHDWLGELLPLTHEKGGREYVATLGQAIYTPEAFASPLPQPDDRPFAGWLYGELAVSAAGDHARDSLTVNLGVVGPAALGEFGQKLLHSISGDAKPRGWRYQLENEPALLLRYTRHWFPLTEAGSRMDMVPGFGLSLGNVLTQASISLLWRYGSFLTQRAGPISVQPALAGSPVHFDYRPGRTDWQVYLGGDIHAVAQNLFLDGNTFRDSPSVERRPLVWDALAGLQVTFGRWRRPLQLNFNLVVQAREFEGQEAIDHYGSITISIPY